MVVETAGFVETLALPKLATTAPRAVAMKATVVDVSKPSASLIKGQVQSFTAGLTGQDRQDIEYITLAAQLNSDVKVPKSNSLAGVQAWFKNYASVMSHLGMVMSFNWEHFTAASRGVSVDKVIVKVLAAVASQNGAAIATAAMDALSNLDKEGGRIKLFKDSTVNDEAGKFLLGVASRENESISLAFGAFGMNYKTRDTSVLWIHSKSSDVDIYKDQRVATFNQDSYAREGRAGLEAKLSGHVAAYVDDLDLGL